MPLNKETFPIRGFIMTFVIGISSARECELYSMYVHLHEEPNSSKPNQTEW